MEEWRLAGSMEGRKGEEKKEGEERKRWGVGEKKRGAHEAPSSRDRFRDSGGG